MRLSLVYDDIQAVLAASVDSDDVAKPLRGGASDADLDISIEKGDGKPTEPAEHLRPLQRQNNNSL
jgi:hypothetical protein